MGIALLLRHGRSTANVDGILAGRMPGVLLHASGREQAQAMAVAFAGMPLTSVHVSPLERTRETADLVLPDREHVIADEIVELDCGLFTGRSFSEIEAFEAWNEMRKDPAAFIFPEGEAIQSVASRVVSYVTQEARAEGLHVFVTHADNILIMANHAARAPLGAYQRLHVEPCSLTAIHVDGDDARLLALNVPPSGVAALLQGFVERHRASV
jgi:broad specificity phosphatase PhoE